MHSTLPLLQFALAGKNDIPISALTGGPLTGSTHLLAEVFIQSKSTLEKPVDYLRPWLAQFLSNLQAPAVIYG